MIASYLLNPTKHNHNLGEIAQEYLDRSVTDYKEVVGTGMKAVTFDQIDLKRRGITVVRMRMSRSSSLISFFRN